jgi:hypothetical protein
MSDQPIYVDTATGMILEGRDAAIYENRVRSQQVAAALAKGFVNETDVQAQASANASVAKGTEPDPDPRLSVPHLFTSSAPITDSRLNSNNAFLCGELLRCYDNQRKFLAAIDSQTKRIDQLESDLAEMRSAAGSLTISLPAERGPDGTEQAEKPKRRAAKKAFADV